MQVTGHGYPSAHSFLVISDKEHDSNGMKLLSHNHNKMKQFIAFSLILCIDTTVSGASIRGALSRDRTKDDQLSELLTRYNSKEQHSHPLYDQLAYEDVYRSFEEAEPSLTHDHEASESDTDNDMNSADMVPESEDGSLSEDENPWDSYRLAKSEEEGSEGDEQAHGAEEDVIEDMKNMITHSSA